MATYTNIPSTIFQNEKMTYQEVPSTATSSASSIAYVLEKKTESNPSSLNNSRYGATSISSTVNPNDENESVYLLWTDQLLKESIHNYGDSDSDSDEEDICSLDSSVGGISRSQPKSWLSYLPFC
ncbi:hypothetical protein BY458DRAFT_523177 [Sporodiniella umbellata]|nr:hypothetical protein BY458DRAFT_523177 [Sporodiniella umbellata]